MTAARSTLLLAGLLLLAPVARAEDPWRRADAILEKDGREAARAYAESQRAPDLDALKEYLKGAPPLEPDARRAFDKAFAQAEDGHFRRAVEMLATIEAGPDTVLRAEVWRTRAVAHFKLGETEPLLAALRCWRGVARRIGWLTEEFRALELERKILTPLRRYEELVDLYGGLAKVQAGLKQPDLAHEARVNKAAAMTDVGRVREALEILRVAIEAAREHKWPRGEAFAYETTAVALWRRAEYARALDHLDRAEELWKRLDHLEGRVSCANLAGNVLQDAGDYDAAEAAYRRIDHLLGEGRSVRHAFAQVNLGIVESRRGNHKKGLELLRAALEDLIALEHPEVIGFCHYEIGEILFRQGEYVAARESFDRALKQLHRDPLKRVQALAAKADACVLAGDLDGAQSVLETARAIKGGDQDRLSRNRLFEVEGRILLARDRPKDALASLRKAIDLIEDVASGLSDQQTSSARERRAKVFQVAVESAFRTGRKEDILEFLERGRAAALRDAIGSRQALQQARLPRALAEWLEAAEDAVFAARRILEVALQGESLKAEESARAKLKNAEEQLRQVTNRAGRESKRLADVTPTKPSSMQEIQGRLRPEEVLVYYALQERTGHAFLLTAKTAREKKKGQRGKSGSRAVSLKNMEKIAALCEEVRRSAGSRADTEGIVSELKTLLVQPLELTPAMQCVIVCPDGPLSYLPWPVLLGEKHGSSVPSGSTLVLLRDAKPKRGRGILALGDPDYTVYAGLAGKRGRVHCPLPESRKEVKGIIGDAAGSRRLQGLQANEAALKKALRSGQRWRAVHFACHGIVDDRSAFRSGLALARDKDNDGFLAVPEILSLDVPADLVVLSACDSAGGRFVRGEGVMGLARAFMVAGAPLVLASTWKVDDAATRELMIHFYGSWRNGKVTAAQALRKAQRHVASKEGWEHPYYWAAWVLWGSPD